ncbi:MAG: ABC transporter permease [Thermodesulfobacteriota bacterium]
MRAMLTVVRKELNGLFSSPIAYIALTALALSMSLFFLDNLKAFNTQIMILQTRTAFNQISAGILPPGLNLFEQVLLPTVTDTALVLLAVIPLITMGMFCEERTRRTDELLLTLPLSHTQIAAGKFLATFVFLVAVVAISALLPAVSAATTGLDTGPILASLVGLLLLSFAIASIGLLCSALATNQLVAALSAYAISMAILDVSWMMEFTGDTTDRVLQYLSLMTHMGSFPRGIISLTDIVYFTGLGLGSFLLARVSLALERIN